MILYRHNTRIGAKSKRKNRVSAFFYSTYLLSFFGEGAKGNWSEGSLSSPLSLSPSSFLSLPYSSSSIWFRLLYFLQCVWESVRDTATCVHEIYLDNNSFLEKDGQKLICFFFYKSSRKKDWFSFPESCLILAEIVGRLFPHLFPIFIAQLKWSCCKIKRWQFGSHQKAHKYIVTFIFPPCVGVGNNSARTRYCISIHSLLATYENVSQHN